MKKPPFFLPAAAAAAAALWLPAMSLAQTVTTGLPGYISYQGRVLNSSGGLVGAGTPVNRTVVFRIWDHPSNTQDANLIYSETQTVTIADGEFSVLVGQGVATTNNQFTFSETPKGPPASQIANAFNGSGRYLAVTVDDGTAAVDNEITPRQQIVSSAFAYRSKYAETIGTSTNTALTAVDSGNIGVGTTNPPGKFTITGANTTYGTSSPQLLITDSADPNERLRIGVDSTGSGSGYLQSVKEGSGFQSLLLNPSGGNVGINKANPAATLDVNGVVRIDNTLTSGPALGGNGGNGQRLVLWPGTTTTAPFGFGIENSTLWAGVPENNLHKWYEGLTERMRLSKGNLGIGSTDTTGRLTVGEASGSVANWNAGTLILDHDNSGGASSLVFRSKVNRTSDFGYLQYQDTATIGGTGESAVLTLGISNDGDDHIALMPSGNVGVGLTTPNHKLHVSGGIAARPVSASQGYVALQTGNTTQAGYIEWFRPNAFRMAYMGWDPTNVHLVTENGANFAIPYNNVGIGTTSPSVAKLCVYGWVNTTPSAGSYLNGNNGGNRTGHGVHPVSIYAEGTIWSGQSVIASSDERIKNIVGVSNSEADLETLQKIKVTDYHYKDVIGRGDIPQKKVIAQQLEKIFPQAVSQQTDCIPDIYKTSVLKDGWVQLTTDLKKGERVKLITDSQSGIYEVLEVKKDMFRTDFDPKAAAAQGAKPFDGKLFVFGREVKDFRTVDYDALSMLNISATQELKKETDSKIKALEDENSALKARVAELETKEAKRVDRVAELEAQDKTQQVRLAAIEKLLQSSDKIAARPVSTNNSSSTATVAAKAAR